LAGTAQVTLDLDSWVPGFVAPSISTIEILPPIPLAERRPVSARIGQRMKHPDSKGLVSVFAVSPDGSRVFGSTYPENTIQIWDGNSGDQLVTIRTPREMKGDSNFLEIDRDFSNLYGWIETNGDSEATSVDGQPATKIAFPDSALCIWDAETGIQIDKIQNSPPTQFRNIDFSPRKTHLFTWENLPGTFTGQRPHIQRMLNVETGVWTELDRELWIPVVDHSEKRVISMIIDDTGMYQTHISIMEFPSFREIQRIELPPGVHSSGNVQITEDDHFMLVDFRTYERMGVWSKWKTTVLCIELESGKLAGKYEFPFDNDSPRFKTKDRLADGSIVLTTWRASPARAIALKIPGLEPVWDLDLGDSRVGTGHVSPDGQWVAFHCQHKSETGYGPLSSSFDWDLVPQSELKIFNIKGELLETMIMPVGSASIKINNDSRSGFIGALGAVYKVDLSCPFENEQK
jgi:hypothetical protein